MKFSIQIATKDRVNELLITLSQLNQFLIDDYIECVVIDDGSTDETFVSVKELYPKVKISRNETSKGYMFCRNKMLNETEAEFVISLDDDANFLTKNPFEEIEKHFNFNLNCAVIAARIYWTIDKIEYIPTNENTEIVKSFIGCGHVWRVSAWKEISNYPEWYQFYGEENFASMQLFKKGWQVHYLPTLFIQHRVNLKLRLVANKDFSKRFRNAIRADWYNMFLFYPISKAIKIFCYSLWIQFKNKIIRGNFKIIKPLILAKFDLVSHFFTIFKNRRPFSKTEFQNYNKLKETKIYWKP
jgi:glycosyltransferase involved in cell wall biosynthesis